MNRPSLVINRCGSWGIRTPGTRNCARQFSKLLVSATHPNFQSFGSLTSQHSFSECGCKGKEKNQFHQTFLLFFFKKSLFLHDIGGYLDIFLHTDLKEGYTMTANNCFAGADRDGYGPHPARWSGCGRNGCMARWAGCPQGVMRTAT